MYKLLLCWRYLRTRYIALASIVSVTLGVATMIVVNSVMSGFTTEMRNRIHGILSDVILESRSLDGFADAEWHMAQIRKVAGDSIEGMTATVAVPAMLNFRVGENWVTRPVQLIGIDAKTHAQVGDFAKYLQHPDNRNGHLGFNLHNDGYDVYDHQAEGQAKPRDQMADAGWIHRRRMAEIEKFRKTLFERDKKAQNNANDSLAQAAAATQVKDPFAARGSQDQNVFDPAKQQNTGVILGIALGSYRTKEGEDRFLILPGDDVKLTFPNCFASSGKPEARSDDFTIVDFYESKMSEYDSSFVFVPIEKLQQLRGGIDPTTGVALVNSIQIRLKPGADAVAVRDKLRAAFNEHLYIVETWQDKQGALLAAVQVETAILNVLLFLIIAVAGFGILAIFLMIVVEKTKDIGILKSLGASAMGIMGIFLAYGLSLGLVGSGVGMVIGLLFVRYINEIADLLGEITGTPVFDPQVYYFYKIPTIVDPLTIIWIVVGALFIAVLASVLPALRAAALRPVEALRYE